MKFTTSALITTVVALLSTNLVQAAAAPQPPSRTLKEPRQVNKPPGVVEVSGSGFVVDGKPFRYVGTTAYWLTQLTDDDIKKTLQDIASKGIKVVRTWAFHDVVDTAPTTGTYIRLWNSQTKTSTLNQAGLDKLKVIVSTAETLGLKIHFSLTNNWNPTTQSNLPKGALSNDYGGIDTYVQVLKPGSTHDCFYTDDNIIKTFKANIAEVIEPFKDSPAIFGWEMANDPRCSGGETRPSGNDCKPEVITKWTNDVAGFVKSIDPNHLSGSGDGGFYCVDCPKIFARTPRPRPSNAPGQKKRSITTIGGLPPRTGPLTRRHLWEQAVAKEKLQMKAELRSEKFGIRGGKWQARAQAWRPKYIGKRQDQVNVGPAYTGSQGVDSDDIIAAPNIDFSSFQLYPDQNSYSPDSTTQNVGGASDQSVEQTTQQGVDWINQHADSANAVGKPIVLTGFGTVNQEHIANFRPFDGSTSALSRKRQTSSVPTVEQQVDQYTQWANTAVQNAVDGIQQYQWGQTGLSDQSSVVDSTNSQGANTNTNGYSPDDGYAAYNAETQNVLQNTAQAQNAATG